MVLLAHLGASYVVFPGTNSTRLLNLSVIVSGESKESAGDKATMKSIVMMWNRKGGVWMGIIDP